MVRSRRLTVLASGLLLVALFAQSWSDMAAACVTGRTPAAGRVRSIAPERLRPNLVLIVTDDQRWDTLSAMPSVRLLLGGHGVTFTNMFVTTPLCCPARASFLTGRNARHHGVFDNTGPNGGAPAFDPSSTVATWLHDAGYTTALVGKYLNGYPRLGRCSIPPGWDEWDAFATEPADRPYDYTLNRNGTLVSYGHEPQDHQTLVLTDIALDFVRSARQPFFLYLAPSAPHRPANALPEDVGSADALPPWRPASYDEADVSDKPWADRIPPITPERSEETDRIRRHQIESLTSLDREIGRLVEALDAQGLLDSTVIAFTSDNGFLWGEHRLRSKAWPYEESIRVPLVVRTPWATGARFDEHLVLNTDLAPTFAQLAGTAPPTPVDGTSLLPLLRGDPPGTYAWRTDFVVDWLGRDLSSVLGPAPYEALRTERYAYVEYADGTRELYDLAADPLELTNLAMDPARAGLLRRLAERLHEQLNAAP